MSSSSSDDEQDRDMSDHEEQQQQQSDTNNNSVAAGGGGEAEPEVRIKVEQQLGDDDIEEESEEESTPESPSHDSSATPAAAASSSSRLHSELQVGGGGGGEADQTIVTSAVHLPDSLATAALTSTPLQTHMILFPSHGFDTDYQQQQDLPVEQRLTAYEQYRRSTNISMTNVAMNTPDVYLGFANEDEEKEGNEKVKLEPQTKKQQQQLRQQRAIEEEDDADQQMEDTKPTAQRTSARIKPTGSPTAITQHTTNTTSLKSLIAQPASSAAASATTDDTQMEIDTKSRKDSVRPGFVTCAKCRKVRTYPTHSERIMRLPATWTCDQNTWDPRYARCMSVEESFGEGEFWPGMPVKYTRLQSHYEFYKRVIELRQERKSTEAAEALEGEDAGNELERYPSIRKRPLDLLMEYETVTQLGGYDQVTASNQWRIVQSRLKVPEQWDSTASLRRVYKKWLYDYEIEMNKPKSSQHHNMRLLRRVSTSAATTSSSADPTPTAADSMTGKKRAHKIMRSRPDADEEMPAGGADADDTESSRHKKQRRHSNASNAATMAALNEELADDEMADESDGEVTGRIGGASAAASSSSQGNIHQSIKNLRSIFENRFRQLERRNDEKWRQLESQLMRTIKEGLHEIKEQTQLASAAHRQRHLAQAKDLDRKQDLLARGMNMLISERLKANLPKLTQIKLKNTKDAKATTNLAPAAAAASSSATPSTSGDAAPSTKRSKKAPSNANSASTTIPAGATPSSKVSPHKSKATNAAAAASADIPNGINEDAVMDESKDDTSRSHPFSPINVTTFVPVLSPSALSLNASSSSSTSAEQPTPRNAQWVKERLLNCDAICFDVDSTVSAEEGIDVLAAHLGLGAEVAALTTKAMNGAVKFEDALRDRLDLMKPSRQQVEECVKLHPATFTPGFLDFVDWLRSDAIRVGGLPIYLVSGGFRLLIEPIRLALKLDESHVFANRLRFNEDGTYVGFDPEEFTSRSGGKARALEHIAQRDSRTHMAMIGDGMTDVEACPPAKLMIGYGGITVRAAVKEKAHYYVTNWKGIKKLISRTA